MNKAMKPAYEAPAPYIWDNTMNISNGLMHLHHQDDPYKQPQAWYRRQHPESVYLAGTKLKVTDILQKQRTCLAFIFKISNG